MAAPQAPPLPHWPAAVLKGLVLVGGTLALGGVLSMFAIGVMANGRGIASLDFSWTMFGFTIAAGLAQGWLSMLGCRTAWRWINAHSPR